MYTIEQIKAASEQLEQSVEEAVAEWREQAATGDQVAAALVAEWEWQQQWQEKVNARQQAPDS